MTIEHSQAFFQKQARTKLNKTSKCLTSASANYATDRCKLATVGLTNLVEHLIPKNGFMVLKNAAPNADLGARLFDLCCAPFPKQRALILFKGPKTNAVLCIFADLSCFMLMPDGQDMRLMPAFLFIKNMEHGWVPEVLMKSLNNGPTLRISERYPKKEHVFVGPTEGLETFETSLFSKVLNTLKDEVDAYAAFWAEFKGPCLFPNGGHKIKGNTWPPSFPQRKFTKKDEDKLREFFQTLANLFGAHLQAHGHRHDSVFLQISEFANVYALLTKGTGPGAQSKIFEIPANKFLTGTTDWVARAIAENTNTGIAYRFSANKKGIELVPWPFINQPAPLYASNHEILQEMSTNPLQDNAPIVAIIEKCLASLQH